MNNGAFLSFDFLNFGYNLKLSERKNRMNDIKVLPAPVLSMKAKPLAPWHAERDAYWRLHGELLKTHEGKYVAIYKGAVVENGASMEDVALAAVSRFGNVPMFIHRVTQEAPKPMKIFGPRMKRRAREH